MFESAYNAVKDRISNIEVNASSINTVLGIAMEVVESTQLKGAAQKTLVEKIVRKVIVEAPISDEREKLLLDMCDQGVLGGTIEMIVSATKGEFNINAAVKVASGCCLKLMSKCK